MSRSPAPPVPPAAPSPEDVAALLDLLAESLPLAQAQALTRRLASEPALAAERAALERLSVVARQTLLEVPEQGLAQRLALRVRDRVAFEERAAAEEQSLARETSRSAPRWGRRVWARVLLASLAAHVAVLGWILLTPDALTPPAEKPAVAVAVRPHEERDPGAFQERTAPLELGPIVAPEWIPDDVLERRGLELAHASGLEDAAPEPHVRLAEHPWPVQLDMLARSRASVRRGRLERAGLDAQRALESVTRGLDALAGRQLADGGFPVDLTVEPAARAPYARVGLTGLALLPFLAEGRRSVGQAAEAPDPVVSRGIAWLRGQLDAPAEVGLSDLSLGLLALAEDYMLSYGRFDPSTAAQRAVELSGLVRALADRQAADGSFPAAGAHALWPLLALDAAAHTGVVSGADAALARLGRWFESLPRSPEGLPLGRDGRPDPAWAAGRMLTARRGGAAQDGSPDASGALLASVTAGEPSPAALAAGLALYRGQPAEFGTWNRAQAAAQTQRLGPSGVVLRGDPIADTALVLLALQSAYRAY